MGGGNRTEDMDDRALRGLSPRGRGKPQQALICARPSRSIPAWAGETRICAHIRWACAVYPRVGGGNPC